MSILRTACAAASLAAPHPPAAPTVTPATVFESQLDSLVVALDTLASRVKAGRSLAAQHAFHASRTAYKRIEGLLGFYAPEAIVAMEGPLEAEGGVEDVRPRAYNTPGDFPQVESALFPHLADSGRTAILARLHAMRERVVVLRSMVDAIDVGDDAVLDGGRTEIARVSTLDIAGFDSDRQDDALLDAAAALDGVRAVILPPAGPEPETAQAVSARLHADSALRAAADYLRAHPTFERMDRLTFVARYSVPASHALAALKTARGLKTRLFAHLWRDNVASVYDSAAFEPLVYASRFDYEPTSVPDLVALGAKLFRDPLLSGPRTRSCATCHLPGRAFTDGLPKRAPIVAGVPRPEGAPPARHTPTLFNAGLSPVQFADDRARSLEQQVAIVLADPDEMGSSTDTAVARVSADSGYRAAFARVFGASSDRAVTDATLRMALAAFVRSLTALNSPFDRAARGDTGAMSPGARRGFTVFMGKARCGTCHFAPLFNGTQPPFYRSSDPEIIGVPERPLLHHATLDSDPGRGLIDRIDLHKFAFKVPTVRNSALTAPYMHNGAYRSLDDVVAFYDAGGGTGVGVTIPYQTLFDQPLKMTPRERADLIAFLRALTDTTPH